MKLEYILVISAILFYLFVINKNICKEPYDAVYPYRLKDVLIKNNSHGYPSYYTPISNCNSKDSWLNYKKTKENFQLSGYKKCVPIATLTLYTSSNCGYCQQMKPEWDKFIKNVKSNCIYNKLIKIVHKKDSELDNDIKYVPTIKITVKEDILNKIPEKTVEFKYDMSAKMFEKFVIENIMNHSAIDQEGNYYTECDKKKMYNKYYTLCDSEHKKWNTY
jgi:hypothetical protein